MPEGKAGKVKGCAAQLDADALEAIMSSSAGFEGLRSSLHDVWLGHKEDPHKVLQKPQGIPLSACNSMDLPGPSCSSSFHFSQNVEGLSFRGAVLKKQEGALRPGQIFSLVSTNRGMLRLAAVM